MQLVIEIYKVTAKYPSSELYRLASQMNASAVSIPSNIAEGSRRGTRKDYCHFLTMAYGSGAELETQVEISKNLPFGKSVDFSNIDILLDGVMRMLNAMISKMK